MKTVPSLTVVLILSLSVLAGPRLGIAPRSGVLDYPAHTKLNGVSVGAALLTPKQVRQTFASDIYRGYAVVEIGVYPEMGKTLEVARDHFVLRVDQTWARPADPKVIPSVLDRNASGGRSVDIYPTVGVGYESGGYDPVTGTTRGRGIHTGVGVGVGVGGPASAPRSPADRNTMELELTEKGLGEGPTEKPIAGYLYFPRPEKKKNAPYILEYQSNGQKVLLRLEP